MTATDNILFAAGRPVRQQPTLPRAASVHWPTFTIWLLCGLVSAVFVAWLAHALQSRFAPLLLFPLLVGFALALCLIALARLIPQGHRRAALWATLPVVILAVAAQHYFSFLDWQSHSHRQDEAFLRAQLAFGHANPQRLPDRPQTFLAFLTYQAAQGRPITSTIVVRDAWAWGSWIADAVLTCLSAALVVAIAWRRPFCPICRSWFHTTRSAQINQYATAELFTICGLRARSFSSQDRFLYHLKSCRRGCEPTIFELSWRRARALAGESPQGYLCLPLDHHQRDRVVASLDRTAPAAS